MNVNTKGAIGEAKVLADLISRGYEVFIPFSGHSSADIIVLDKNSNKPLRLQIKYRKINSNGSFEMCRESVINGKRVKTDLTKLDGWAVYVPNIDKIFYFNKDYITSKTGMMFHVQPARNRSDAAILGEEYSEPSILWRTTRLGDAAGGC